MKIITNNNNTLPQNPHTIKIHIITQYSITGDNGPPVNF